MHEFRKEQNNPERSKRRFKLSCDYYGLSVTKAERIQELLARFEMSLDTEEALKLLNLAFTVSEFQGGINYTDAILNNLDNE